ncbi:MAG: cyclic nucleotide-binding domain-containing protein [Myxococcales bacterium]|nr:cyclic nucleotide-binding domain-containing protein [Myxococcales bacterium]
MRLLVEGQTDVGRTRGHNEDFFLSDPELGLFVVCDGMGGHAAGELASRMTAETVREVIGAGVDEAMDVASEQLRAAVERANQRVFELGVADRTKRGMGTTCSALLVRGGKAALAHVGDSRLYLRRGGELHVLSHDHTFLAEAVRQGVLTPEQARESEHGNIVTRAVGPQERVLVDVLVFDVLPGDVLLLCSDGLHQYFEDDAELGAALDGDDEVAATLVATANERGGEDNITALLVRVAPSVPAEPAELDRATQVTADLSTLHHVHLFSELDLAELTQVCAALDSRFVAAGETIVEQGEGTEGLYVIVEGEVEVLRDGARVALLPAGAHFGEMALLNQRPRSATVRASTDCRLLHLPRDAFYAVVQRSPVVGVKFLWRLAQTLGVRLDDAYDTPSQAAEAVKRQTLIYGVYPSPFHPRR